MSSRKRSSAKEKNPVQSQASKKKKKASGSDPFYNGLKKAGFVVGLENEPNELEVDQDKFLRVLEKNLPSKESVETFVSGLEKLLEDDIRFKWCLLPTVTSSSCKNARNERQDSFLHLLLNVESLQENVGKLLLQKLADFSFADSSDIFDPTEGRSLSCMILSQFRSLSRLVNSSEIAEKLLEFVRITPVEVQKDIISLLPEILHVSDHDSAARVLAEVLVESSGLTVTVLTALSNLAVDEDTLATVREQVLKTLSVAKIEDLPGIARFVLTDLRTDDMKETIREVRQRLEIAPEFDPEWSSTPISIAGHNTGEKCNSVLLIDSIKLTIQFQKQVCDSWIQVLDSVGSSEPFRAFDIIMIFVLHSISLYQKKVENMVKRKVRNGELSEKLLSETFKHNSVVLRDYLSSILSLSEAMLKLPEAVVSSFGSSMYVKSFECFKTNSKQNVVGNLVTHAGSGLVHERDAAINTLLSLVRVHTSVMGHFGIFIKNLLDYFDSFTLMQVRKVYEMLSYLTYQGGREGHMMEDDMQMIIRKQLKNNDIKYAKIGVIGALVTVKTVCCKPEVPMSSEVLDSDELIEKAQQHAVPLLELAYQSVINYPEALALFFDELCRTFMKEKSIPVVDNWVEENLLSQFEPQYITDIIGHTVKGPSTEADFRFGLDESDDQIALNLYGALKDNREKYQMRKFDDELVPSSQDVSKRSTQDNVDVNMVITRLLKFSNSLAVSEKASSSKPRVGNALTLLSLFRLLHIKTKAQDPVLESIDGLLGCPILVPELRCALALTDNKKHLILDSIFYCMNWIRENLNAFASIDNNEMKMSVVLRLQLLIELQEIMMKHLKGCDNYLPPIMNFDFDASEVSRPKLFFQKQSKNKKRKKGKGSKKSKKNTSQTAASNCAESTAEDSASEAESENECSLLDNMENFSVAMASLQPFFRELDISVFKLFKLGITLKKLGCIYAGEKERELSLHPSELQFLLDDMLSKIRCMLQISKTQSPFSSKQPLAGFSNLEQHSVEQVVKFCIELFPALCHILEEFANYFRYLTSDENGSSDSQILSMGDSTIISNCMQMTFKVLNSVLSWKQFALGENEKLLKNAISNIASREETSSKERSLQAGIETSIEYLVKFDDAVFNLSTGAILVELLGVVSSFSDDRGPLKQISVIAKGFLKKNWPEIKKRKIKAGQLNSSISTILLAYLKHSEDVLESLVELSKKASENLAEPNKANEVDSFSTLRKSTLGVYYKIMLSTLVQVMKVFYDCKRRQSEELRQWSKAVDVFHRLVGLIKTFESRSIISATLKYGRQFIDIFLKSGMPFLDKLFSSHREQSILLVKNLQSSTRYLQHVCLHSKVVQDVSLIRQVPFLKKSLERFVYRVKLMLAVNKCQDAFWVGNLKNRDLKGNEILSQQLNESDNDSSPDDESGNEGSDPVSSNDED